MQPNSRRYSKKFKVCYFVIFSKINKAETTFLKKKFGGIKKSAYLCTRFEREKQPSLPQ